MFGLSFGEMFVLGVMALIVIGPKQLPEFARQVGRILNELKRAAGDFTEEMKQQVRVDLNEIHRTPEDPPPARATTPEEYAQHISASNVPVDPSTAVTPPYLQPEPSADHSETSVHSRSTEVLPSQETTMTDQQTNDGKKDTPS